MAATLDFSPLAAFNGTRVPGQLAIGVAHKPDLPVLVEELRSGPVQMRVDAVLVAGVLVFHVVGEAQNGRELVPLRLVEIGIGPAHIHRAMPYAEIRQTVRVVVATGISQAI